ncbi:MAG TPA: ATP-binding protein [Dehalococcoidia bacterium]|nr:ATP-binding protein [Dehalococcoidia bacterium]
METPRPLSNQRKRLHLRTRLALALILVFIPVFALVVYTHIEALNDRRDSKVTELSTVDQTLAASFDGFARDLESFSQSTSLTLSTVLSSGAQFDTPESQQSLNHYFKDLATSYNVRSIFLTDLNGTVVGGTSGNTGASVADRDYFKALKSGQKTVWSDALAGQETGQTTLAFGTALSYNNGPVLGYFFVAFYPPQINGYVPPTLPPGARVTLIDRTGTVLLDSSSDADTPALSVADWPAFQQAANSEVTIRNQQTPLGSGKTYGALTTIPTTGWVVGITRPASAIDGPLRSQFQRNLEIMAAAFLAAIGVMLFVASRLSAPLISLADSAGAIARGEQPDLSVGGSDYEVMQLQQAMQSMSEAIRERESALQQQRGTAELLANQLARLHAARNALAPLLPPDDICAIVVTEAVDAIGARAGSVLLPTEDRLSLRVAAQSGYPEEALAIMNGLHLDRPSPFTEAFSRGEPLLFATAVQQNDAYPDDFDLKRRAATQATAFLPLRVHDQVLGVLSLGFERERSFSQDDVDLMFAFANQAAQSLQRALLFQTAEQSARAKDEFLGIIAHELRTPVTSIFGSARLLNDNARVLPDGARVELMETIEVEADRLAQLVETLLLLARAELGRAPDKTLLVIDDVVGQALEDTRRSYPKHEVTVTRQCSRDKMWSDQAAMRQVLFNLLSNAAKYAPEDAPIELLIGQSNGCIDFHVMDRGPGVPPEELGLIFDSFYRSKGTAGAAPGKGMGLAVCRTLVQSLGGSIAAELRPGGGLDVAFHIPEASTEPADDV